MCNTDLLCALFKLKHLNPPTAINLVLHLIPESAPNQCIPRILQVL